MNKEELTRKIMSGLKESLNESIKPSDIYDDGRSLVDGSKDDITIASVWDDGSIKFRKAVSKEEREAYKKAILKNKTLVNRFDIKEDSFINESKTLDLKTNKDHKAAYNSFVKWYNRWKEKLGREEIRALVRKVTNDALGDNLDTINDRTNVNESRIASTAADGDEHLAFDLYLTFANTRELKEKADPMIDNLLRRLRKGEELSQVVLANSSIVERYAKATIDEYRRSVEGASRLYVSPGTRKALKLQIAELLIRDAEDDYSFELHDMESNLHK